MQELEGCCLSSRDLVTLQRSRVGLEVGGGVVSEHNVNNKEKKKVHLCSGLPTHQPAHMKHREACG